MRDALAFADSIVDTMRDPLLVLDKDLRVVRAGREFYRTFAVSPAETEGRLVYELGNRQWDIPRLRTLLEEILPRKTTFRDFEVEHVFEHIGRKVMLLNARTLYLAEAETHRILLVIEDVTERRDAADARRQAETTACRSGNCGRHASRAGPRTSAGTCARTAGGSIPWESSPRCATTAGG